MFHNVLAPSPLYQNMFRPPVGMAAHPAYGPPHSLPGSTSFLVENLLRERHPGLMGPTPGGTPPSPHALVGHHHPHPHHHPGHHHQVSGPHHHPAPPHLTGIGPYSLGPRGGAHYRGDMHGPAPSHLPAAHSPPPGTPHCAPPSPGAAPGRSPSPRRAATNSPPGDTSGRRSAGSACSPPVTPYLKFGVNAILSSEVSPKAGEYRSGLCWSPLKMWEKPAAKHYSLYYLLIN